MTVARASWAEAGTALRWGACLALVLGLHAGAALVLLRRAPFPETPIPAPDAVMLELAPAAAPAPAQEAPPQPPAPPPDPAPDLEPKPDPEPSPEQPLPVAPSPVEPPPRLDPAPQAVPPAPRPAVVLPEPPPAPKRPAPRLAARPQPPRPAQASPSQQASEAPAPAAPATAPSPAVSAPPPSSALPGWKSELAGRLQRAKRYPDAARAREEQGAAAVTFTIDRGGHVLSASLVRSSGSQSLDEEAVALVRRADPLPPVPAELAGSTLTLTVPVTFSLR